MQIAKKTVVSVHYKLYASNQNESLIEKTSKDNPMVFLFGKGQLIQEFEDNLKGLKTGDDFDFKIITKNAYGEVNPNALVTLPRNAFQIDGKEPEGILEKGKILDMQDQEGNPMRGTIKKVEAENVKMDFNHPLAGVDLHFKGTVKDVRAATKEELDHGHVHGDGGVHHH